MSYSSNIIGGKSQAFLAYLVAGISIGVVVLSLYYPVLNFEFINLDDDIYVFENPHVISGLTSDSIKWAFTESHGGHWHPVTWVSHMLDWTCFGSWAGGHHLVNVLFHCANAYLLFLILFPRFLSPGLALLIVLLFACHPLRLESVAWVSERKDVLSIFFGFLTLTAYIRFTECRRIIYLAISLVFYSSSLMSKPTLVTLPVLLVLVDQFLLGRCLTKHNFRKQLSEKIPYLVLALASCVMAVLSQSSGGGLKNIDAYPLADRLNNAFLSYVIYFGKFFWTHSIGIFYPFEVLLPGTGIAAAIALCMISFVIWQQRKIYPEILFGWSWFLISFLPLIGFVQIGGQAYADRWTYVPHIGLYIALGIFSFRFLQESRKRKIAKLIVVRLLPVLLLLILILKTASELPYWSNSSSIYERTLRSYPQNFLVLTNLASAQEKSGEFDQATSNYERALALRPSYIVALNNLGTLLAKRGDYQSALGYFDRALKVDQQFTLARYNLGLARYYSGNSGGALINWIECLIIDPGYLPASESLRKTYPGLANLTLVEKEQIKQLLSEWKPIARDRDLYILLANEFFR